MLGQIVWSYWAGWPGIHGGSYLKTYVGNLVSLIMDQILPDRWSHVISSENPADCASRGLLPSELLDHKLWWKGPTWHHHIGRSNQTSRWSCHLRKREILEICLVNITAQLDQPIVPFEHSHVSNASLPGFYVLWTIVDHQKVRSCCHIYKHPSSHCSRTSCS